MQTFLPLRDFRQSARCLDRARLGKQRVECLQILNTLTGRSSGWANHPAVWMWRFYTPTLALYMRCVIEEWVERGYQNNIVIPEVSGIRKVPPWLGNEEFHKSHQSNLLRKMPEHYMQFGWDVPHDLPYVWPVKTSKK